VLEVRHAGIVRGAWSAVVINLDNLQGGAVVNLGGLAADGRPRVPITLVNDARLLFERPAGAVSGPAFVEVLILLFIPFASSGEDPDGAFTMPEGGGVARAFGRWQTARHELVLRQSQKQSR